MALRRQKLALGGTQGNTFGAKAHGKGTRRQDFGSGVHLVKRVGQI